MWIAASAALRLSRIAAKGIHIAGTEGGSRLRPISRNVFPVSGTRNYSRDPEEAERLANTVSGHRRERANRERLQNDQDTKGVSNGSNRTVVSRAIDGWRRTPLKWTTIPLLVGLIVLIGVQANRQWAQNSRIEPVLDASGHPVRIKGPWSVRWKK